MNEPDVNDLLHRATRDLAPDVDALVAGGLRRGRVRQRRRRTAMTQGAGAATVLVTAGAFQLSGELAGRGSVDLPANPPTTTPTSTPTPGPTRTVDPAPASRARLAVTTDEVPATFASLEPGEVSPPLPKSGPDSAPVVDFTWNGLGVRVGLTPDDYTRGERGADPAVRCAQGATPDSCRPGPGGAFVSPSTFVNPPEDGGTSGRSVVVFRPDGWDVLVLAYDGPRREGPVTADEPPFDLEQLEAVASSDVWFR
jgi:hypothetical protein